MVSDMFNQFFNDKLSSIASNISSRLPSLSQPASLSPLPHSSSFSSFSPVPLALADSLLLSLSKPSPLDIVPCSLLKSCHSTFSVLLTKLANLSFASGKFPDCYKVAQISPLLKKSTLDPSVPSSYRPIANLRTLGKLLERLAQAQLRPYLLSSPAFSPYQSAYRPGFSTETAALFITNNLLRTSAPSLLVFLDLSSAFDCVLHTTLLDRLSQDFSLSDLPIAWLRSYLTSRSQYVMWEGARSLTTVVTMGVPQGSVLGPLLFSAYVSPISRLLTSLGLVHHSFADDTTLILTADSPSSSLPLLERSTTILSDWFAFNGLQLNADKSEVLLVGTQEKRKVLSLSLQSHLVLAGTPVVLSSTSKILGVTFDPALNFDAHVSDICRSANFHLRALSHIRHFLSISSANLIASSIISSRLDYCNSLLLGVSSHNIHRLQMVQNRAARLVLGVGRMSSSEPLLRQLHWLPVHKRIQYKTALLTFKTLTSNQPSYLSSLLIPYRPSRSLRSSNSNFLTVPRVSTSLQSRAFSVAAPHLWNTLPASLRAMPSLPNPCPSAPSTISSNSFVSSSHSHVSLHLPTFKSLLKTHLFDLSPSVAT